MTPKPLTTWKCDTCAQDITDAGKALVVWRADEELRGGRNFQIVHKSIDGYSCDRDDVEWLSSELSALLGTDGLNYALALLSPGPIKGYSNVRVEDFDGFVDLVRRCQTPWYEEARQLWQTDLTEQWLAGASESYPYQVDVLERIAKQESE